MCVTYKNQYVVRALIHSTTNLTALEQDFLKQFENQWIVHVVLGLLGVERGLPLGSGDLGSFGDFFG